MASTFLPLNIVTPSGSKSRTFAPPNASLADLRLLLVKDAIIKPHTRFHLDGVVINTSAEVHMQWTDVIREIHVCDDGDTNTRQDTSASPTYPHGSLRPQPYPSPSHTLLLDKPKCLTQPLQVDTDATYEVSRSGCEGDTQFKVDPPCEIPLQECGGYVETATSPKELQSQYDAPKEPSAEYPKEPCEADTSGCYESQEVPLSDCGGATDSTTCRSRDQGVPQGESACPGPVHSVEDLRCELPYTTESDLDISRDEVWQKSDSSVTPQAPATEQKPARSRSRPLSLPKGIDGYKPTISVTSGNDRTPSDFDDPSPPCVPAHPRTPSRPSTATKAGFNLRIGIEPLDEVHQPEGYGPEQTGEYVTYPQRRLTEEDYECAKESEQPRDTELTQRLTGVRASRSDTVLGGGILGAAVVAVGGKVDADVQLSTGGRRSFVTGNVSLPGSVDRRLDESWRHRLDIVNTVKTVMQVGCTDRLRFALAFGGLDIDADLFQGVAPTADVTLSFDGGLKGSSDVNASLRFNPLENEFHLSSSPSVSTISIGPSTSIIECDGLPIPGHCVQDGLTSTASISESEVTPLAKIPLYRLYSPSLPDHFYTTNAAERDASVGIGYTLESTAAQVLASPSPEGLTIPFFRIYRNKEHFYTADVVEKERVVGWSGTRDEGIAGYVYPDRRIGTVPLYRLYNRMTDDHFYTTSAPEREVCIQSGQWNDEGVACYVYP